MIENSFTEEALASRYTELNVFLTLYKVALEEKNEQLIQHYRHKLEIIRNDLIFFGYFGEWR